jgi:hypothetical protein
MITGRGRRCIGRTDSVIDLLERKDQGKRLWTPLNLDHLEIFLPCAAVRAPPVWRHVVPARAGAMPDAGSPFSSS